MSGLGSIPTETTTLALFETFLNVSSIDYTKLNGEFAVQEAGQYRWNVDASVMSKKVTTVLKIGGNFSPKTDKVSGYRGFHNVLAFSADGALIEMLIIE